MPDSTQFTIATYNIQFGIHQETILENIARMAENGVGMICLQEVIKREHEEFILTTLVNRLGKGWEAKLHVGNETSRQSIGTAILYNKQCRFISQENILLPKLNKFNMLERFYYKVVGVKAEVLQRKAISCLFTINQTDIRVTCVHLDNVGGTAQRMKQVTYLMTKLNTPEAPTYEIICGDFNTFDLLKTGYEKKVLQNELGKDFIDASGKIDWSSDLYLIDFSTSIKIFPWFIKTFNIHIRRKLDYIWVKNLSVQECNKQEYAGSDHFPLLARIEIPSII